MKKNLLVLIVMLITTSTTIQSQSHDAFLRKEHRGEFTSSNIPAFKQVLKEAIRDESHPYFKDEFIGPRLEIHFEQQLKNRGISYPGATAVIDGMEWIPAEQYRGTLAIGMLRLDHSQTDFTSDWTPRPGEVIGVYKGVALISTYCGNLAMGDQKFQIDQPKGGGSRESQGGTTVNVYAYGGNSKVEGSGNATMTNPAPEEGLGGSNLRVRRRSVSVEEDPGGGYYYEPAKPRFVNTFGGQVVANTLGTAGGILLEKGIQRLFGGGRRFSGGGYCGSGGYSRGSYCSSGRGSAGGVYAGGGIRYNYSSPGRRQ